MVKGRESEEGEERESRRQPQSLNQKNAQALQTLARLRAERQKLRPIQINSDLKSIPDKCESKETSPKNQEKGLDKVRITGRRRLCKVSANTVTSSSHSLPSDGSQAEEGSGENYFKACDEEYHGLYSHPMANNVSSKSKNERKISVNEISSKLHSLNIKNCESFNTADIGKEKFNVECRASISDTFNSLSDSSVDECNGDDEYEVEDEKNESKGWQDEESACSGKDTKDEAKSPVHSSDAPDFESAQSALSSLSHKGDDGEENYAESTRDTSFFIGAGFGDQEDAPKLLNTKTDHMHGIFCANNAKVMPSKVVEQNKNMSQVCTAVEVSSSASEPDPVCSENDNDLLESAKSVKVRANSRASLVKGNNEQDAYEINASDKEDTSSAAAEDAIVFTDDNKTYTLNGKIAKHLYAHQREGIKWFWDLHCKCRGGILGDDMGLGKTMQVSAFLLGLFSSNIIKRALIVAPKTLIAHWMKELSFVGLARKTRDYSGSSGSAREYALLQVLQAGGILLTTYDIVRNNRKAIRGEYEGNDGFEDASEDNFTWDYVILDEGHIIKNPSTQRAKSLREIPSKHRIIISGTPIQNNLREMWALFDFCVPGLLGDKRDFKGKYEEPILRSNDKKASQRQKWIGSKVAEDLRHKIQPYFLRRMKTQVFPESGDSTSTKLAKKDDIIVWLKLTGYQRQVYTAYLKSEAATKAYEPSSKGRALAALTVLKKICDHPGLLTKRATDDIAEGMESMFEGEEDDVLEEMQEEVSFAEEIAKSIGNNDALECGQRRNRSMSCKIAFLMVLLHNLISEEHRVLIFAQTRKMLDIIQEEIKCKGYDFRRIDGTLKACDRAKLVNEFQSSDTISIFLLTSQVGGLGLTLTGADRVVVVDPAWNPSTDNQSVDRAYRIGQLRNVLVYRLMTCGTIEEKIYRKQVFKGGLFKTATEHKQQTRYFSEQELRDLFTIPESGFDVSLTQKQLHEEHDSQHEIHDSLKKHLTFLEGQGIAGVSHHSMLYSKTETVQAPPPGDEDSFKWDMRRKEFTAPLYGYSISKSAKDDVVLGHEFAFRPKDLNAGDHRPIIRDTLHIHNNEAKKIGIKENIIRLEKTLANKALLARLPDKGENLQKKVRDLTNQLINLQSISSESVVELVPESSSDSVLSIEKANASSSCIESERSNQLIATSHKENIHREREDSVWNGDKVINLEDISSDFQKLSVQVIKD
ncbi:hypothetical protein SUGI_0755260 [Cryptomeria japonica]|uniref:SNF2 domain-containing protein ENL1 n=1 Tax=Cryptomeria japonica TaxID=3369 RepID=UPI0024149E34|nr:SNF2 domain-containing protein ENL1 [Cryptomeria japonica]GLJ37236.1 hypothetical protein SUGI_0755260 [Cryptomeria japonica]